ncbi:MAG: transketolase [Candidatus Omnitrophica bacterium]|nr:transketolase [Candidatus Omnitrophota bacterium]
MDKEKKELQNIINTVKALSMDGVQKANSGHPGFPMGMADVATILWTKFLQFDANAKWPDRDRFVLSAGHGSMLLYSLLHLAGFNLSLEDLKNFRQWGSHTPGHPEYGLTHGVETTTGPLGQGFTNAVGMALAEAMLAETFNTEKYKIVDHYTYALVSDGDLMEGLSGEAASFAGHLGLGKMIFFYDDNHITIEGNTSLAYSDDVERRFQSYHWHVLKVDGYKHAEISRAIKEAQREKGRPSLIICKTHIGKGSPNKEDSAKAHGEPLGEEEVKLTKKNIGWPEDVLFYVPPEVREAFCKRNEELKSVISEWEERFKKYRKENPELAALWDEFMSKDIPKDLGHALPDFRDAKPMATRNASGEVLQKIAEVVKNLVGGSADLAPSTKTMLKNYPSISPNNFKGRNIHFGVREHAMGAIINGMALHGGLIPYGSTFLVFADYMRPAIRLAAMSKLRLVYVFTHDSIFVGEDGPTHEPVEQIASLRTIPYLVVIRPADAQETACSWKVALERKDGPVALILTRQGLPILDRNIFPPAKLLEKGAYILKKEEGGIPDLIIIATGSEVHPALEATLALAHEGIKTRLVNMPSQELFEEQDTAYKEEVLPPEITKRLVVEAGISFGWEKYAGPEGIIVGINRFGASAPYKILAEKFGFTAENILKQAKKLL